MQPYLLVKSDFRFCTNYLESLDAKDSDFTSVAYHLLSVPVE
jgi:hypothetical protein